MAIAQGLKDRTGFEHASRSGWFSANVLEIAAASHGWSFRRLTAEAQDEDLMPLIGYVAHDNRRQAKPHCH